MSEAKHTPGPWKLGNYGNYFQQVITDQLVIADVNRTNSHEDSERQANARLIAAAPELLDALRKLHSQVVTLEAEGRINTKGSAERRNMLTAFREAAKRAIAKAEGRE